MELPVPHRFQTINRPRNSYRTHPRNNTTLAAMKKEEQELFLAIALQQCSNAAIAKVLEKMTMSRKS